MSLQLAYDGAKRYLRQNPRQSYELIHVASKSDEVLRIAFEKPLLPTRLVLPADYANDKLLGWNQKNGSVVGNPWIHPAWGDLPEPELKDYFLGELRRNVGTSVTLRKGSYYANAASPIPRHFLDGSNFTIDKANNKYEEIFYLDNDLEETDPTVIIDDGGVAFWTVWYSGSGSNRPTLTESDDSAEKAKGVDSYKIVFSAGAYDHSRFYHLYGSGQDWSDKEFVGLYIYGSNSGHQIKVWISSSSDAAGWGTNGYYWLITDNWTGWKRVVFPLNDPDGSDGSPNLAAVRKLVVDLGTWAGETSGTLRFDRIVVDVGQWAKIEAFVPNELAEIANGNAYFQLFSWDGSTWHGFIYPKLTDQLDCNIYKLYFLDGTTQQDIMGGGIYDDDGIAGYLEAQRGETKSVATGGDSSAGSITYSAYYGCLKRVGFAIKMPPDDGQDSSTAGISQCKLKLEVYYADSEDPEGFQGQATYEFKPDNNHQFYGLDNLTANWFALFDATLKRAWYFVLDMEPKGMKVCADEDESIHWMEVTLQAGCRVFAGELHHANMTRDGDSNDVPDFLEGTVIPGLVKGVPSWL